MQPTSHAAALVIAAAGCVTYFRTLVLESILTGMHASKATAVFRSLELKGLYRILEKAMFRAKSSSSSQRVVNCENVLDVCGCMIRCGNFTDMTTVIRRIFGLHDTGEFTICRVKDRFANPTLGGWRDIMINVRLASGVIFEFQVVALLFSRVKPRHTSS